jgi:serine/threonine protein kinase
MIPSVAGGLTGQRLGDYELTALLGAGGMAEVYRGLDVDMDRAVAVKVLPAALSADPGYAARFRAEVRRVAALDHPHIVPIYHYGEERGLLYLVMPILKESLRDRLERGQIPLADATRYATEIAAALDTAHAQGIIHRDVKPENILLDEAGAALLTDFAIARELPMPMNGRKTPTLSPIHTPLDGVAYLAPEQLRGVSVDQRADVYALGAVLYELLTGVTPHEAPTPYEVAALALTQPILPPSARNPAVWPELERVVLTALAADPAARHPDMRAFMLDLRRALAQQPSSAAREAPAPSAPVAAPATQARLAQLTSSARVTPRLAPALADTTPTLRPAPSARLARAWRSRPRFLPRFLPGSVSEAGLAFAALIAILLVAHLALGTPMPGVFVGSTDGLGAFGTNPTGQTATSGSASPTKTSGGSQGGGTTSSGSATNPTGTSGGTSSDGSNTTASGTPTSGAGTTATPSSGSTPGGSGGGSGGSPGGPSSSTPTAIPTNSTASPPSLALSPASLQLTQISTSGGSSGTCAATQTVTNSGANAVTWQWGALPVSMHFNLNGQPAAGNWPNGTLGPGASATLQITLGCSDLKSAYTVSVNVTDTSTGKSVAYSVTITP